MRIQTLAILAMMTGSAVAAECAGNRGLGGVPRSVFDREMAENGFKISNFKCNDGPFSCWVSLSPGSGSLTVVSDCVTTASFLSPAWSSGYKARALKFARVASSAIAQGAAGADVVEDLLSKISTADEGSKEQVLTSRVIAEFEVLKDGIRVSVMSNRYAD